MYKLTAKMETATKTDDRTHYFETAEEALEMKAELKATQITGSTGTCKITKI